MDEVFEIITWRYLKLHNMPIIMVNIDGYYDLWKEFTDHIIDKGFASNEYRDLFKIVNNVEQVIPSVEEELGRST